MNVININKGWKFYQGLNDLNQVSTASCTFVNVPHIWNNLDTQDHTSSYLRCSSIYVKEVEIKKNKDKDYYIEFEGVSTVAKVFINEKFVGEHKGGFSTFRFNVSKLLNDGKNIISLIVNNLDSDEVYPRTKEFKVLGGIHRDVNLIEVNKSRFDLDYFGSGAVWITPKLNEDKTCTVSIDSYFTNVSKHNEVEIEIFLNKKKVAAKMVTANKNQCLYKLLISEPVLWDGTKNPAVYDVYLTLYDGEIEIDARHARFGIRNYDVTKDGFYLNGRKYELHGVSYHQERVNKGFAVSKEDELEDIKVIKELGANAIHLTNYQHDQYFYNLCDDAGMVVWTEIPYIENHLLNGDENALIQLKELIIQNYNHPGIMFWGLSNKICEDKEDEIIYNLHTKLNNLAHELDKTRPTIIAFSNLLDSHAKLLNISDVFTYNQCGGCFPSDIKESAKWLTDFKKAFPKTPLGISEYGAKANISLHSGKPIKGDYSEEYQCYYHEKMLDIFEDNSWLWSTFCSNVFDFATCQEAQGGVKGINIEGLVTADRKIKKDSFFAYKAFWSDEGFVHICSKRFKLRKEKFTTIKVYSNLHNLKLYKGKKLIEEQEGNHIYLFKVPLSFFGSKYRVVSKDCADSIKLRRVLIAKKSYKIKVS